MLQALFGAKDARVQRPARQSKPVAAQVHKGKAPEAAIPGDKVSNSGKPMFATYNGPASYPMIGYGSKVPLNNIHVPRKQ